MISVAIKNHGKSRNQDGSSFLYWINDTANAITSVIEPIIKSCISFLLNVQSLALRAGLEVDLDNVE